MLLRTTLLREASATRLLVHRVDPIERGVSSVEFAIVLPLFMTLFFTVLGLSVMAFSILFAGTGVPVEARSAATGAGPIEILAALQTTAPATGAISVGAAPGCERAIYARLSTELPLNIPMLPEVGLRLRGGSVMRNWRFWPGPPTDGCD